MPMFLDLTNLVGGETPTQQDLARALEIEGPTLTRHLDGLERAGLVTRTRDEVDRRAVRVAITRAGRDRHAALLQAVIAFDGRLRSGLSDDAVAQLRTQLGRLAQNVRAD